MKYREVAKKLRSLGCYEILHSDGSHRKWFNPQTNRATSIPDWGAKDIKLGTLKAIVKQVGFDWKTFEEA